MLKRGEIAQSILRRRDRNRDSTKKCYRLLTGFVDGKRTIPEAIVSACGSQGALAALSMPEKGIHKLSLNTLKGAAVAVITDGQGGWKELNRVRKIVWEIGQEQKGRRRNRVKRRKEGASDKAKENALLLEQSIRARAALTRAYSELLNITRHVAKKNPEISQRLKRHLAAFGDLGFRSVSENEKND